MTLNRKSTQTKCVSQEVVRDRAPFGVQTPDPSSSCWAALTNSENESSVGNSWLQTTVELWGFFFRMAVLATRALAWSSWKSSSFKCWSRQTEIKHRSSSYNRQTAVTEGADVFPVTTLQRWSCMFLLPRNTLNPYHLYTSNWDLNHNHVSMTFILYELNVSLWVGWVQECFSEKIQNDRFKTGWMSV